MEGANTLLTTKYNYSGENKTREKVVIVFTDGVPTTSSDFDTTVATNAIKTAKTLKDGGVTIFTVGIFTGANPEELYGASGFKKNSNGEVNSYWEDVSLFDAGEGISNVSIPAGNRFLNYLSSNYLNTTEIGLSRYGFNIVLVAWERFTVTKVFDRPDSISQNYYLTADNAEDLTKVFQTISETVGGSSSTLTSTAVLKDTVSPYFTAPKETTDITVQTADCTGKSGETLEWGEPETANFTPTVKDGTISVTGFDYMANWCGSRSGTFGGKKLIISFTVQPKDGFLGGNGVPTNAGTGDGVYASGDATEPTLAVESPTVDVPINYTLATQDQSIYLTQSKEVQNLLSNSDSISSLDGVNNAYVDVAYNVTINSKVYTYTVNAGQTKGNWSEVPGSLSPSDCTEYPITCTVTPKIEGTVKSQSFNPKENPMIHVFKPTLTFQDSTIYLGETASYTNNYVSTVWKHETETANVDTMGPAPDIKITYTPEAGMFEKDTPVKVTANINGISIAGNVTFINNNEDVTNVAQQFTVHVKTCSLTIKKEAEQGTTIDTSESFIFNVTGDNTNTLSKAINLKVAVQGDGSVTIDGLPVGTYTVTEESGWSWRYDVTNLKQCKIKLSTDKTNNIITVTNSRTNNQWLSGSDAAVNVFGNGGAQ